MKKLGIMAAVILILLIVGGFMVFKNMTSAPKAVTETNKATTNTEKQPNTFSSISDAIARNLSIQCDFSDLGGMKAISYMKGGMIRIDLAGKTPDQNASLIMRDNKMYYWTDKMAFMTSFNIQEMSKQVQESTPSSQQKPQDYVAMMEKYKDACKEAAVSDTEFVIPSTVKFQDMSNLVPSVPAGAARITVAPSMDYQELLKQYQNAK
ncbi:MAG: hypothetical protein ACM3IJ_03580 [Candidatus Levyibacteriota bacterium]